MDHTTPDSFTEETMKRTHSMMTLTAAIMLATAAPFAFAQSTTTTTTTTKDAGMQHPTSGAMTHNASAMPPQTTSNSSSDTSHGGMSSSSTSSDGSMMGEHTMDGTVTSVNGKGMVEVKTGEGTLRLHFPDAAKNLKKGDKIDLHLSYSKE